MHLAIRFDPATHMCMHTKLLQSCPTLCDPIDYSPPGSSVHGILQARILEWVATSSSKGSSQPRDRTWVSCDSCVAGRFFSTEPPGKPTIHMSPTYKEERMFILFII